MKKAGVNFVKTLSGVGVGGATVEVVKLIRDTVGEEMGVKASGGINNLDPVLNMIKAGANRVAVRPAPTIVDEMREIEQRK